jgi:hypothetical protein
MDGLITTFAVVTAVVGGDLKVGTVLILYVSRDVGVRDDANLSHPLSISGFANMLGRWH